MSPTINKNIFLEVSDDTNSAIGVAGDIETNETATPLIAEIKPPSGEPATSAVEKPPQEPKNCCCCHCCGKKADEEDVDEKYKNTLFDGLVEELKSLCNLLATLAVFALGFSVSVQKDLIKNGENFNLVLGAWVAWLVCLVSVVVSHYVSASAHQAALDGNRARAERIDKWTGRLNFFGVVGFVSGVVVYMIFGYLTFRPAKSNSQPVGASAGVVQPISLVITGAMKMPEFVITIKTNAP
jgi:hypothetical protein